MAVHNNAVPLELGTENIGKLLMKYAGPAIIAMTASSLYNMIDSIFIGHGVGPMETASSSGTGSVQWQYPDLPSPSL